MLKVFIVEDEVIIREGLKQKIPWEAEGFCFAGEASDGELAYPLIKKEKPDILITDIRMPFMNGLELARLVKKELPNIKILFLSGYDEFEYAKEAIRIGATDYLLKPITSEKLLEAVRKVAESIRMERKQEDMLEQYRQEQQEKLELERGRLLNRILENELTSREAIEQGRRAGIDLAAPYFRAILFKVIQQDKAEGMETQKLEAYDRIWNRLTQKGILIFEKEENIWLFILKGDSREVMDEKSRQLCREIQDIMENYPGLQYFGGIGSCVNRISDLGQSYYRANKAFAARFFTKRNQFVSGEDMKSLAFVWKEEVDMEAIDFVKLSRKEMEIFLRDGTADEIDGFLQDYFESIGKNNYKSIILRQYLVMDLYFWAMGFLQELGSSAEELPEECQTVNGITQYVQTEEGVGEYLNLLLTSVMEIRDRCTKKKFSARMERAREYIDENYRDADLSLNKVAGYVNMSPCYFSSTFSQETGKTFIEYLTGVRMRHAKDLLRSTSLRSSEVASESGYQDSHYFSFLFKKTQGCTPSEYRKRGREDE